MNAVSWRAQQNAVAFCLKISQSSSPSLPYPLCPLLKPVPADSLPGVPIPRRHARCHGAKRAPHSPRGETRCQLGHRITLGATERIPDGGMCDISWLPSLSSRQSWRPQLCLRMLTGYVTRCPSDTFPGRESEYEMIVLFTSYLWHWLLAVRRAAQREIQSGCTAHLR